MQLPWRFIRRPARYDRPEAWPPTATQLLVAANATGFLVQWMLAGGFRVIGASSTPSSAAVQTYGALSWEGLRVGYLWQPFTCLFLHENAWSLVISLVVLYLAGRNLEIVLGRRHLVALYLGGGLLGGAGQLGWHTVDHGVPAVMGATPAVMALFIAFACAMPEWEVTPLLTTARMARPRGVRVKHLAMGTVLALAALVVINPGGRMRGQADLAGWLLGCVAGALYMRQLGFGRRRSSPGSTDATEPETLRGWSPKGAPDSPSPSSTPSAVSSSRTEVATIAAADGLIVPRFTERERRMTAREYIAEQIDPILDKILRHGLGSLNDDERRVLEKGREKMERGQKRRKDEG